VIPSFTNPNNLSIITGRPPAVHGIAGNYFYDREQGVEVMMNDPKFLRAPTILAGVQRPAQGRDGHRQGQAAHPARQGLDLCERPRHRVLLGEGRPGRPRPTTASTTCSASSACRCPSVYSADLSSSCSPPASSWSSINPDLMYLSTTDYIQHKAAPGTPDRQRLLRDDRRLSGQARCARLQHRATADHGMNDKFCPTASRTCSICRTSWTTGMGKRARARDPADHRSLRRPSRLARLVRHHLHARGREPTSRTLLDALPRIARASRWR
jgi:phosphonoacetate hydrolase